MNHIEELLVVLVVITIWDGIFHWDDANDITSYFMSSCQKNSFAETLSKSMHVRNDYWIAGWDTKMPRHQLTTTTLDMEQFFFSLSFYLTTCTYA